MDKATISAVDDETISVDCPKSGESLAVLKVAYVDEMHVLVQKIGEFMKAETGALNKKYPELILVPRFHIEVYKSDEDEDEEEE